MTDFDWIRCRRYVAIGTDEFDEGLKFRPLTGVAEELRIVVGWLTDERLDARRFTQYYPELAKNPKLADIERCLRIPHPPWDQEDAVVVYITGHGVVSRKDGDSKHWVVLKETKSGDLSSTAVSTAGLLEWFANKAFEHLLVIIDLCFAGQVAEELGSSVKKDWLILPSALKNQQAEQGVLAKAIERYVKDAEKFNKSYPYLQVGQFVRALNAQLPPGQRVKHVYKGSDNDRHVSLPNPSYDPRFELVRTEPARQDLALLVDVLPIHNRVGGELPSEGSPGWLFTSRQWLMRHVIAATRAPGVTLVTGSAGSGKSMALSRLVTLSDPEFRDHYADELAGVPADLMPSRRAVTVALSAQGLSAWEVAAQVCSHLGVAGRSGTGADPMAANLDALSDLLAVRTGHLTIVLDALDEAFGASDVVTSFLRPLWEQYPTRICLLIGVRSPGGADIGGRADDAGAGALATLLVKELGARSIRADDGDPQPNRPDPDLLEPDPDLLEFVRNILLNTQGSPYRDAGREEVDQVAGVISGFAKRSYLMASVAASLAADPAARVPPGDQSWLAELSRGLFGAFRRDLQKSFTRPSDWRRGVALLRAVAFAQGTGLPWDRVWPEVATAVDSVDAAGRRYGDEDVRWLLGSRLSAYLVTGDEDGLTVYRLIHDELRDILRHQWRELLERPEPSAATGTAPAAPSRADDAQATRVIEARIARRLRAEADVDPTSAVDEPVPPYVRRHFVEHALAGGALDRSLPVSFLPYLDIARLATAVGGLAGQSQLDESLPWLPVVRRVMHLWDWERPARNAAAIEMWAALGEVTLPGGVGGSWDVRWAARPLDMSTVLGRQQANVRAVAVADLPQGPVAVTGGGGGLLYTWDLSTSARYRDRAPIGTGRTAIVSIAIARLSDQVTIAVTGSDDGTIRFWDVATGHAVKKPLGGGRAIKAVATARLPEPDGRVVVIAADAAGVIRTWDLASLEPVGMPVPCGPGLAHGITTTQVDGQVLGLATGEDSGLQVWDVATGLKDGPRLAHPLVSPSWAGTLQGGRVIAAETLDDVQVAIVGDGDGLLLWNLRTRESMRRVTGSDGKIRSLVTARLNDRVLAVTGANSAVQVLDLKTGEPVGHLMRGHDGSVEAAGIAIMPDGSLLAVSGSRDESVRTWDVPGAALPAGRVSRHAGIVEDVATAQFPDRQAIAATCSGTAVQVWDLDHGDELVQLTGHESPVVSVAAAATMAGVLVAAGHWDGTVSAWRAADGARVSHGRLSYLGIARSLSMAALADGRVVAVAGCRDGSVRAWDPLTGTALGEPVPGHAGVVVSVMTATTADGRFLVISGGKDGQVLIRDLGAHLGPDKPEPDLGAAVIDGPVASLAAVAMPEGRPCVIVGGADGTVRLLDLLTGVPVGRPWKACSGPVAAVAAGQLPGGRPVIFTGGADALVQAWDPSTGRPVGEPLPVAGPIRAVAFQAASSSLVVGGLGGVAVTRPCHGSAS